MNRSYTKIKDALTPFNVPVLDINRLMIERAISQGKRLLVVATHGPTVESMKALILDISKDLAQDITLTGVSIEEAWDKLTTGDIQGHNQVLAEAIRKQMITKSIDCVVLSQLSMSLFHLSYANPNSEFGVPILGGAQCSFEYIRELLSSPSVLR